jgi:prepilin-type N-terminal cleavage/methylation domain-containing protein
MTKTRRGGDQETGRSGDKEQGRRSGVSLSPCLPISLSSSACRRGYSLVEMTVVMTVGAILLGIAVTLLGALLQADRSGRAHIERNTTLGRLADRFRRDVHAGRGQPVAEKNKAGELTWRFDLDGACSVLYMAGLDEMVRQERVGKTILRQESYALPEDHRATIAVDGSAGSRIVSLTIAPTESSLRPGHEIRIDALVGRDHRFAKAGKGRK